MADITEEEIGDLSTIYWWLQGYFSSHTEEELPSEYVDTLCQIINRHNQGNLPHPLENIRLVDSDVDSCFVHDDNGDFREEE